MKKLLPIFILLVCGNATAQIVNIPDAVFKDALLNNSMIARDLNNDPIIVDANGDGEIQESEAANISRLDVSNFYTISSVTGIESFINLERLDVSMTSITSLDLTMLTSLEKLTAETCYSLLTVNVSGLSSLKELRFGDSSDLDYLDITDCWSLEYLDVSNILSVNSLDFTNFTELQYFTSQLTGFDELNFTGCTSLTYAYVGFTDNLIMSDLPNLETFRSDAISGPVDIDFGDMPMLSYLSIWANGDVSTIDLSGCPALNTLSITADSPLQYINLKNGDASYTNFSYSSSNNGDNIFICIDEDEESYLQTAMNNNPNLFVSTYCSFTPGGDYNTITGTTTFDLAGDGCDASDIPHPFIKININDGTNSGYSFTDAAGEYKFYTGAGSFTVTPEFENDYFTPGPADATVNFPAVDNSVSVNDFCIGANGVHPDIEVVMVPVSMAQPGFDAVYKIVYKNKGNTVLSGSVNCQWDPTLFETLSLDPAPTFSEQGNYGWDFTDLQPFENREVTMVLNVNAPTDTPPVNIDDVLQFTANAVVADDAYTDDNSFVLDQVVVGAYDPNNIICIQGEMVNPAMIGEYLHYVVNFENTGTAAATFIVVKHELDPAEFDVTSVELLNSSHDVEARINGDLIEFIFNNINLEAAGHGNILFKVKSRNNLMVNDNVTNSANIYFDYNFPVLTNNAVTTFAVLSQGIITKDDTVSIYPNPASGTVNIKAATEITSVQLYDIQGRLLQIATGNTIDVSARQAGIYFVKITTPQGGKVIKLVRE